ncbi:MAG: translation initiation factor IF-2 [Candidatus Heimdallarchaeota archaeon]|nr:MAG: translation initiation factor IF-2 [Candidatus Heimdallarchaeota archaeon]
MTTEKKLTSQIRSPITVILGHVDSGKTSLLDKVRGTAVQSRESGGITQHIGASFFPIETVTTLCGSLLEPSKKKLEIPGILIIDTPGHSSFMNLRQRGASAANFAILVIDVRRGIQPQTVESLRILVQQKVPFLIAANKIDRLSGWKSFPELTLAKSLSKQSNSSLEALQSVIYEIMTELSHFNLEPERFDRIKNFAKKIAIIPTSAITGEGIPELFLVLAILAEQFLKKQLELHLDKGRGVVLEVKKEVGMGTTLDVILFDGTIKQDSQIVLAGIDGPISTKVRAILMPKELDEIRDPRKKFDSVERAVAAIGVKLAAPNIDEAIAGSSLYVIEDKYKEVDNAIKLIEEELASILVETDEAGVIVKADTLGSLEALVNFLRDSNIQIRFAAVGEINKKDVYQASLSKEKNRFYGVILGFRCNILPDASEEADKLQISVIQSDIIYRLAEEYEEYQFEVQQLLEQEALKDIIRPSKIKVLPYVFRQSKPCIVGVEVLSGMLTPQVNLINRENKKIGLLLQIQDSGKNIPQAKVSDQVAVAIRGPTAGRQIREGDELWVDIPEADARKITEQKLLSGTEMDALTELIEIKRRTVNKYWAL